MVGQPAVSGEPDQPTSRATASVMGFFSGIKVDGDYPGNKRSSQEEHQKRPVKATFTKGNISWQPLEKPTSLSLLASWNCSLQSDKSSASRKEQWKYSSDIQQEAYSI